MPFASHAYKNYLKSDLHKDSDVIRNFYEAMHIFLKSTFESGEIFSHRGISTRPGRSASIYGLDSRALNNSLIEIFDGLMKANH